MRRLANDQMTGNQRNKGIEKNETRGFERIRDKVGLINHVAHWSSTSTTPTPQTKGKSLILDLIRFCYHSKQESPSRTHGEEYALGTPIAVHKFGFPKNLIQPQGGTEWAKCKPHNNRRTSNGGRERERLNKYH